MKTDKYCSDWSPDGKFVDCYIATVNVWEKFTFELKSS